MKEKNIRLLGRTVVLQSMHLVEQSQGGRNPVILCFIPEVFTDACWSCWGTPTCWGLDSWRRLGCRGLGWRLRTIH